MKKVKKYLSVFLATVMSVVMMLTLPQAAFAKENQTYSKKVDGITYTYTVAKDKAKIVQIKGKKKKKISVPSKLGKYPVSEIGALVFGDEEFSYDADIIVLPDTVTTIDGGAFYNSEVKNIHFGSSMKNFKDGALTRMPAVKKITVSKKNKYFTVSKGVRYNKSKTKLVKYPTAQKSKSYSVPSTVKTVGSGAFSTSNYLEEIKLPKSVTKIESSAFEGCGKLRLAKMPKALKSIGDYAYAETDIGSVTLPSSVSSVGKAAFDGCTRLKKADLSKSKVKNIKSFAFSDCQKLTTVKLPKTVEKIGSYAFHLTAIKSFTFPKKVTAVSKCVFFLTPLERVTLSSNTKSIADSAFEETKLNSITIPSKTEKIGKYVFDGCKSLKTITVKSKKVSLKKFSFPFTHTIETVFYEDGTEEQRFVDKPMKVTLKGYKDSTTQQYAKKYGFKFSLIK